MLGEPQIEWAVEVTWADWKRAGARGPTSQYGPFTTPESRDAFVDIQRRDREIAATRVLSRFAAYSPWAGPTEADATSEEDRSARLERYYAEMFPLSTSPVERNADDD